jgi:hypothetical protein
MKRLVLAALVAIILTANLISATTQRGNVNLVQPSAEGKPRDLREGESHRYYVWRDDQGWHVRTTTGRTKHFFEGVITSLGGKIQNYGTFLLENKDIVRVNSNRTQLSFRFATDKGIDGFDFQTDAETLRFDMKLDGERRADVIYLGLNGENPKSASFELNARTSTNTGTSTTALIDAFGHPEGMGEGSTKRFLIWRTNNVWHLRTTTAKNKHTFSGEIIADKGSITELNTVSTERRDWVSLKDPKRIFFELTTEGGIDGFDFRSSATNLKFILTIDGQTKSELVYIGSRASNPSAIPFTLPN